MNDLISVIIPVYNAEKYLRRCIESITGQEYHNLEILLIDDGSTDGSANICQAYQQKDPRVKCIRKSNGGVSSARNAGLERANGSWIGFVDADDYLDPKMYMTLAAEAEKTDKDIICCGVLVEDENGNEVKHLNASFIPKNVIDMDRTVAVKNYMNPTDRFLYWSPWDKIIRSDIAKQVRFEEGRKYSEDFDFCLNCLVKSNGIRYCPGKLYHYYVHPGSAITGRKLDPSAFDGVYFSEKAQRMLKDQSFDDEVLLLAAVHSAVSAAKTLKLYYRDQHDDHQYLCEVAHCKDILQNSGYPIIRRIKGKTRILVLIARFFPTLLKAIA